MEAGSLGAPYGTNCVSPMCYFASAQEIFWATLVTALKWLGSTFLETCPMILAISLSKILRTEAR
jgi:hypothetical protein